MICKRTNRRQLLVGRRPDEEQDAAWRRLFQRFQQGVGPFFVQIVGVVDHRDLAAARKRSQGDVVAQPSRHPPLVVAHQKRKRNKAFVGRLGDQQKVGMDPRRDLLATVAHAARIEHFDRPRPAEKGLCQPHRQGVLADAARANQQIGAGQPPAQSALRNRATTSSCPKMPCHMANSKKA